MLKEHEFVIISFFMIKLNHKFVYCISFHVCNQSTLTCLLSPKKPQIR